METDAMSQPAADAQTAHVADLFEEHHEAIFAYLYRLLDDREWAHDLTQETFLKVHQSRERLRDIENERAWIYRIAGNLAFTALKRRRRFAWLPWRVADTPCLLADDPAAQVAEEQRVAEALQALSPTYRAPLLLYSHFGLSVREVAGALDLSKSAVKVRLHRARKKFRDAYVMGAPSTEEGNR